MSIKSSWHPSSSILWSTCSLRPNNGVKLLKSLITQLPKIASQSSRLSTTWRRTCSMCSRAIKETNWRWPLRASRATSSRRVKSCRTELSNKSARMAILSRATGNGKNRWSSLRQLETRPDREEAESLRLVRNRMMRRMRTWLEKVDMISNSIDKCKITDDTLHYKLMQVNLALFNISYLL